MVQVEALRLFILSVNDKRVDGNFGPAGVGRSGQNASRLVHSNRSGGFRLGNKRQANRKKLFFQSVVYGPRVACKIVHPGSRRVEGGKK